MRRAGREPGHKNNPADLSQFAETFEPSGGLFAPGYPLPPVEPEKLRVLDYPVGYNYIYTPRSFEPIGFKKRKHDLVARRVTWLLNGNGSPNYARCAVAGSEWHSRSADRPAILHAGDHPRHAGH